MCGPTSSVGNPYHNSQAESFMKTMKVEEVYRDGYEAFADVAARLPASIGQICNSKGLHSSPAAKPPGESKPCSSGRTLGSDCAMWTSPRGGLQTPARFWVEITRPASETVTVLNLDIFP